MESSRGFFIFLFQIISYYNEPLLALLSIYLNPKKIYVMTKENLRYLNKYLLFGRNRKCSYCRVYFWIGKKHVDKLD